MRDFVIVDVKTQSKFRFRGQSDINIEKIDTLWWVQKSNTNNYTHAYSMKKIHLPLNNFQNIK